MNPEDNSLIRTVLWPHLKRILLILWNDPISLRSMPEPEEEKGGTLIRAFASVFAIVPIGLLQMNISSGLLGYNNLLQYLLSSAGVIILIGVWGIIVENPVNNEHLDTALYYASMLGFWIVSIALWGLFLFVVFDDVQTSPWLFFVYWSISSAVFSIIIVSALDWRESRFLRKSVLPILMANLAVQAFYLLDIQGALNAVRDLV